MEPADQRWDDVLLAALQRQSRTGPVGVRNRPPRAWSCLQAALADWDRLLGQDEDVPGSPAELAAEPNHVGSNSTERLNHWGNSVLDRDGTGHEEGHHS